MPHQAVELINRKGRGGNVSWRKAVAMTSVGLPTSNSAASDAHSPNANLVVPCTCRCAVSVAAGSSGASGASQGLFLPLLQAPLESDPRCRQRLAGPAHAIGEVEQLVQQLSHPFAREVVGTQALPVVNPVFIEGRNRV